MTTYIPDLADEVLVMYGPHRGGVGLVTDIRFESGEPLRPRYFVEGVLPDGMDFTRWITADDLAPAEWGTWHIALTTAGGEHVVSAAITDDPIAPVEALAHMLSEGEWYILDIGIRDGRPVKRAVAIRHIEMIDVIVESRRDHR